MNSLRSAILSLVTLVACGPDSIIESASEDGGEMLDEPPRADGGGHDGADDDKPDATASADGDEPDDPGGSSGELEDDSGGLDETGNGPSASSSDGDASESDGGSEDTGPYVPNCEEILQGCFAKADDLCTHEACAAQNGGPCDSAACRVACTVDKWTATYACVETSGCPVSDKSYCYAQCNEQYLECLQQPGCSSSMMCFPEFCQADCDAQYP